MNNSELFIYNMRKLYSYNLRTQKSNVCIETPKNLFLSNVLKLNIEYLNPISHMLKILHIPRNHIYTKQNMCGGTRNNASSRIGIIKKSSSCLSYVSILSRATRKNLIVSIVTIVRKNGVQLQMSLILIRDLTRLYPCHRTLYDCGTKDRNESDTCAACNKWRRRGKKKSIIVVRRGFHFARWLFRASFIDPTT